MLSISSSLSTSCLIIARASSQPNATKCHLLLDATAVAAAAAKISLCLMQKCRNSTLAVHKYDGIIVCSAELLEAEASMPYILLHCPKNTGRAFFSVQSIVFFCRASPTFSLPIHLPAAFWSSSSPNFEVFFFIRKWINHLK